jgi:hypothetical protein
MSIGGLGFDLKDNLMIYLITLAFLVLLTGVASILSETISKNEIISPVFLVLYLFGNYSMKDSDNLISQIVFPSYHLADYNILLSLILPLFLGIALIFVGYKMNLRREIEI